MKIEPHGSFFDISADGYICNMGHPDNIKPPWTDLADAVKQTYLEHCGDQLHSIYLRGSVVRGLAVPNVSDVDSFAVTKPDATLQALPWAEAANDKLVQAYPFTTGVEFGLFPYDETFTRGSAGNFILKTQSVCLYGDDLQHQIQPGYKPNREVIDQAFVLAQKIAMVEEEVAEIQDVPELTADMRAELNDACTWIMKGVVRSGFELVIEEEGTYTRDLYPCYATFSKHYPEQQAQMYQALAWAINPTSDHSKVVSYLQDFGQWLCQQIAARYPTKKKHKAAPEK